MVFSEIMPQALTLMTDVFGNYVVQKVAAWERFPDILLRLAVLYPLLIVIDLFFSSVF
jgi:hypothetical protein